MKRRWQVWCEYVGLEPTLGAGRPPEVVPSRRYRSRRRAEQKARLWNDANLWTNQLHYFVTEVER